MTKQWQRPGRDVRRYILRQEREIFVSRLCGLYVYALILLFLLLIILYQIFEARNPLDYVTVLLLGLGITFPFALSHYNRYRLFRRRPIGICYGSCVGKVYVCTRYVTDLPLTSFWKTELFWKSFLCTARSARRSRLAARCLWPGSRGGASFQKPSVRCGEPIWYYPRLERPNETYNRIIRYMEEHINEQH